jgi:hypothetical protein
MNQRSTITIDKSFFESHDIHHVESKHPNCPKYLSSRLGRGITSRRQYLSYREKHQQKLSEDIEKVGIEEPRTGKRPSISQTHMADLTQNIQAIVLRPLQILL